MKHYFPDFDGTYVDSEFFWGVYATIFTEEAKHMIKKAEEKHILPEEQKEEDLIEFCSDIYDILMRTKRVSSKFLTIHL